MLTVSAPPAYNAKLQYLTMVSSSGVTVWLSSGSRCSEVKDSVYLPDACWRERTSVSVVADHVRK